MHDTGVYFKKTGTERFILLQLTPELLEKRLFIKSSSMSSSVLCTGNATYQLKDVQQSNSLLFLSANHDADNNSLNIEGEADSWLKTSLVPRPSVQLSQIPLYDGESDVTGVSVETVFSSFPASNFELERELEAALCVEIDSMYVKLESSYALRMIRFIINSVLAAGMALQQIEEKAFREAIADEVENLEVLIFLLRRFSSKKTSRKLQSVFDRPVSDISSL